MFREPASLSAKFVGETDLFSSPFALLDGETVVSVSVTVSVEWGTDPSPQSMLVGAPSVAGDLVNFTLTGGVAGNLYQISVAATTNTGRVLFNRSRMEVKG